MRRCIFPGLLLTASILLLTACGSEKSNPTMMMTGDLESVEMEVDLSRESLPYSVEIKRDESTYCSAIDGRLLAEGVYCYPVVQVKAVTSYSEKADVASPTEQTANRVNAYFERWLEEQRANFHEISTMAEKNYNLSLESAESSWDDPDYYFFDRVHISSWSNRHLVCVTLWRESFTGGAHGISNRQPVTFDAYTGREITINDMTDDYVGLCRAVETEILRQIQERTEARDATEFFKDYKEVIPQWINRSVFFEEDGLQVVFGAYDIAPYAAGEQAFRIPYQLIDTYLNDYGREALELA